MSIDVIKVYEDLHQIPELGFEEVKTSEYLAQGLEKLGYAVTRGLGKTGVMGVIKGAEPGPVLLLRADMDALPFKDPDGSIVRLHACGHDGHSAMLLAAASQLAGKVKKGTLKILFQPAEETLWGARRVLETGAIDDVDIAYGLHVRPIQDIPAGTMCAAVRHTSSTLLKIEVTGRGAHGSRPHLGVNCAEAAALITNAICAIKLNPAMVWSCKVTGIVAAAAATNIIPDKGTLTLDVRAQTNELMQELIGKVRMAAEGAAASIGAKAELVQETDPIPAAVYDEDLVEELREIIRREVGPDKLVKDCGGGGEDFHYFALLRPGLKAAYFGVGAGCTPGLHDRNMHFDPKHLPMGVKVLVAAALSKVG
ncbi:MAG: amidohydrolase [Duodenibacillus sp.]|nr:amidohydrolase [Duodenibacillus sp.]